ncbi:MAG: hypothetical protein AAF560_26810 [Acidobacteriota bacterium]
MFRRFMVCWLALAVAVSSAVVAQVDPGFGSLHQEGQHVGILWVPDRLQDACEYQEHWYLFADYEYPGREHPIETVIEMGDDPGIETVEQFKELMAEEYPGGHHVTVVAIEHREDCR